VKLDNDNRGVDGNEQCSSNLKDAPNPNRTTCNSIAKVRKWDDWYLRYTFFCQILNIAYTFQKCKDNRVSNFLLFNFCNNGVFVEVCNNEIFDFLTRNSSSSKFVNGVPSQIRKYIRGSTMTKKLKSTAVG